MFASSSPLKAYRQSGIEAEVAAASPYRLIILLFDGASTAISQAILHLENQDIAKKGMAISKALDIIANGLKVSVDLEAGGDLSRQLVSLYDYMCNRLLHANLKNDIGALREVANLLNEIHSAWIEIGEQNF